jgi:hypothetical protein
MTGSIEFIMAAPQCDEVGKSSLFRTRVQLILLLSRTLRSSRRASILGLL